MNWRNVEIAGFENLYKVREDGLVWSIKRNKELKPFKAAGYWIVDLQRNTNQKRISVHRLVAFHFIGNPPSPKLVVHHIDSNKTNNHYTNLEWVTHARNIQLAWNNSKEHKKHNTILECTNNVTDKFKKQLRELVLSGDIKLIHNKKHIEIEFNKIEII